MRTQIDFCQHVQMIKSLQSRKMDKYNQQLDAFFVGYMVGKNSNEYEEIIAEVMEVNQKLNKNQITLQEKISYYNKIINDEQKKMEFNQIRQASKIKQSQFVNSEIVIDDSQVVQLKQHQLIQQQQQQQQNCLICLMPLNAQESYRLEQCQHIFHKLCLIDHGKNQQAMPVPCPQLGCKYEIIQSDLNEICDKETKIRLVENSFKNYKQRTKDIIQCPTIDCEGVFVVDVDCLQKMSSFLCSVCKVSHCPRCRREAHQGDCKQGSMIQLVNNKMFKRCNKCGMMIEKNGGCNHIVCLCKNEFCFGCGKEWINREAFYCFCESKLEMKLARIFGLTQAEFKQPEPPARNLQERISRELKYAMDGLLINVTRLAGRRYQELQQKYN